MALRRRPAGPDRGQPYRQEALTADCPAYGVKIKQSGSGWQSAAGSRAASQLSNDGLPVLILVRLIRMVSRLSLARAPVKPGQVSGRPRTQTSTRSPSPSGIWILAECHDRGRLDISAVSGAPQFT